MQCCLEVAAELQQRWRRTNRRRKSIPRSSSSHREGSITQRGASCGRYDQRRRRSTVYMMDATRRRRPILVRLPGSVCPIDIRPLGRLRATWRREIWRDKSRPVVRDSTRPSPVLSRPFCIYIWADRDCRRRTRPQSQRGAARHPRLRPALV